MAQTTFHTRPIPWLVAAVTFTIGILLAGILYINDGNFFYTLDDPYIHLALAKNIMAGNYGLNAGEFSSPVSSILWPLILAPFAALEWGYIVPLIINITACLLTAGIVHNTLQHVYPRRAAHLAFVLLFFSNTIGLVFSGMEHSLQTLLAVAIVSAMIDLTENRTASRGLPAILVIAPLIRYELLALSLGAIALLLYYRQYRFTIPAIFIVLLVGGFSLFLWLYSGEWLPASVYAKMQYQSMLPNTIALIFSTGLLVFATIKLRTQKRRFLLVGYVTTASLAHLLFAKEGWGSRYEVYIWMAGMMAFFYYLPVLGLLQSGRKAGDRIVCMIFTLCIVWIYAISTLMVPSESHVIYAYEAQMTRLIKQAGLTSAAVNDIGHVSYYSGAEIVDLFGLGNREIFTKRKNGDPALFDEVAKKNVPLVMINMDWFPDAKLPGHWVRLGNLDITSVPSLRAPDDTYYTSYFYATSKEAAAKLKQPIHEWAKGLPAYAVWRE